MTLTVGIVCKDGVVFAADKRASGDHYVVKRDIDKIIKITDNIVLTTAGQPVSDIQKVIKLARAELELKRVRTKQLPNVKEAANLFGAIVYENIRKFAPLVAISHFLIAGVDSEGYSLYDVYPDGDVSKVKDYVASGAFGVFITYGELDIEWKPTMTTNEAKDLAVKFIRATAKRDTSVGDGINYVVIDKSGIGKIGAERIELAAK